MMDDIKRPKSFKLKPLHSLKIQLEPDFTLTVPIRERTSPRLQKSAWIRVKIEFPSTPFFIVGILNPYIKLLGTNPKPDDIFDALVVIFFIGQNSFDGPSIVAALKEIA